MNVDDLINQLQLIQQVAGNIPIYVINVENTDVYDIVKDSWFGVDGSNICIGVRKR
jgi:hypothetical protein